jgi:hypothetical protein
VYLRSASQTQQFWRHTGKLAVIGALIAVGLAAAFMSIGHDPQPRDVPVAVVGPPAAARGLTTQAPGELSARSVPDLAAARKAIRRREVYGAVVPSRQGVRQLLIASAASTQVANFLRRTLGRATPENVPRIVDEAPLPRDDSGGLSIGLLVQVLMIGGSIGVIGIARLLPRFQGNPRQGILPLTFLIGYGVLFGLLVAAIAAAFGVGTEAAYIDRVLALAFISVAVTASSGALVALIGPAGSGVAALLYFVLGAQISGAGTAPEFLPPFWSGLGQHLPGGAGTSLLRDVFYFPEAPTGEPIEILAAYVGVGLVLVMALSAHYARRRPTLVIPPRTAARPATSRR